MRLLTWKSTGLFDMSYNELLNSHNTDINSLTGIVNGLVSRIEALENPNTNEPETPTPEQ